MFQAVGLNAMLSKQIVRELLDKSRMSSKEKVIPMSRPGARRDAREILGGHKHVSMHSPPGPQLLHKVGERPPAS